MDIQWPLVLFTLLSGTGGALAAFAGGGVLAKRTDARLVQAANFAAIVLAVIGGLCSVAHLAHPLRASAVITHPAAGIFVEACLLGVMVVLSAGMIIAARKGATKILAGLAAVTVIAGLALAFFSGFSYVMPARPAWDTLLLPLSYLTTATVSGGAVYCALVVALGIKPNANRLALLESVISLACAVSVLAYASLEGIMSTDQAPFAWAVIVLSGVIPAAFSFASMKKQSTAVFAIAAASALVGGGFLRALMWTTFSLGIPAASISLM